MEKFINDMREKVLPGCFDLQGSSFRFENKEDFSATVTDSENFLRFVQKEWDFVCEGCYCDVFFSGFLGSYAFALWFLEFDQDNWFSFDAVQKETENYLNSYASVSHRRELRIIKGSFLPMRLDLPVVVDYENLSVTVWTGELRD